MGTLWQDVRNKFSTSAFAFVIIFLVALATAPKPASAAIHTVTSLADSGPGTLRNAISISASNDFIAFNVLGTITLTNGQLNIAKTLSIFGPGAGSLTISGNHATRVFNVHAGHFVLIQGLTIANGRTTEFAGGGVANAGTLNLVACVVSNNVSQFHGGGVYNSFGDMTIASCTISSNSAVGVAGGVYNKNGVMTMSDSTIVGNSCGTQGGGIASEEVSLSLINCTISGNRSVTYAGGIILFGEAYFNHTTIAFNQAPVGGGVYNAGELLYENCILGPNRLGFNLLDLSNETTSLGHNLSSDFTGNLTEPTDLSEVDPKLRPLGANGGPTLTHALDPLSPAIDAGNTTGPAQDQRGRPRPRGVAADIGSFESPVPILVTSSGDSGPGSLRAAIIFANTNGGTDTILFDPPGELKQINLQTELPAITDPVLIDHGVFNQFPPSIELSTSIPAVEIGLRLDTHDCLVRGFSIIGFVDCGIRISGQAATRNQIMQCFLGVDRNEQAAPNGSGVTIDGGASANVIGTDGDGSDDHVEGNVISGNNLGVLLLAADANRVAGNRIGTDHAGTAAIPNQDGIYIEVFSSFNVIGTDGSGDGSDVAERNIISGNVDRGIILSGPNKVSGNFIGVDQTGLFALPNSYGVQMTEAGSVIGTDNAMAGDAAERNIISGNTLAGIVIRGDTTMDGRVSGNFIGTDETGTIAVPNQTGIEIIFEAHNILIGGTGPGLGNVVAGNSQNGIQIALGSYSNRVEGNSIGISFGSSLPNGGNGIGIGTDSETNNVIGGLLPQAGNVIAYNGGIGVVILAFVGGHVVGNSILGNSIFANGERGIDLALDATTGVNPNDAGDLDDGPNRLQNFPVLQSVASDGVSTYISGTLNSATGPYRIEFFAENVPDESGHGEGETFLGAAAVTIVVGPGETNFVAVLPTPVSQGQTVTATATGTTAGTSEFSEGVLVTDVELPQIVTGPASTNVNVGQSLTLCVSATGTAPLTYQWRLNGVNIPGATNACYFIPSISLESGGSYTVLVANPGGVITSDPALVEVNFAVTAVGDNLAQAIAFLNDNGAKRGSDLGATFEPGEPQHAGKPGGRSVWYRWTPVSSGIATLRTRGSAFDTLLAVYLRTNPVVNVTNLVPLVSDEDGGGFLTSEVRFNAVAGTSYWIAVDGYGGSSGNFAITWSLEVTPDVLPVITVFPVGATVAAGSNYLFSVSATGIGLTYQWFLNGVAILNATNTTYVVPGASEATVGNYVVRVTRGTRSVDTPPVALQINVTGDEVQTVSLMDKFLDAVIASPLRLGDPDGGGGGGLRRRRGSGGALARGYSGTQVFNTRGAASQPGEPNHCNVPGGASQWLTYLAERDGVLFLNTDGSSFDTVLAVYSGVGATGFENLLSEACDNNSGVDGQDSALVLAVQRDNVYYIAVDGVNAASGALLLNYSLVIPATFEALGLNENGEYQMRISGRPAMNITIEASGDFFSWEPLITTNVTSGVFEFTDLTSPGVSQRAYRAVMLP